jgi:hypothetical protein
VTATSSAAVSKTAAPSAWPWPIELDSYPRRGQLSLIELEGLRALGVDLLRSGDRDTCSASWRAIRRLTQPLDDAQSALHWHPDTRHQRRFARDAAVLVLTRCVELNRSYRAWSAQDWAGLIGMGAGELRQSWPGQVGSSARLCVPKTCATWADAPQLAVGSVSRLASGGHVSGGPGVR